MIKKYYYYSSIEAYYFGISGYMADKPYTKITNNNVKPSIFNDYELVGILFTF